MLRATICFTAIVSIALSATSAARGDDVPLAGREEQAFKRAVAFVEPALVRIQTVGGLDRVGQVLVGTGPTTGVVVSADGYIISSAFNFASKPASVLVELPDGRRFPANEIATDRSRMLTLLKIDANDLTPIVPAERPLPQVGQWAIAVGRTFDAQTPSISVGIVSANERVWGKAIQTDAKVSPVNYGGPLIDIEGRALGILVPLSMAQNEATAGVEWYDSGIGFAIPMRDVFAVLERLKEGKDLRPGLMGISFKRDDLTEGEVTIDLVRPDSPAYRAGIRSGDVLLKIGERPIHRVGHLRMALGTRYEGDTVSVEFRHGEEVQTREIVLVGELIPYEAGFLGILPARPSRNDERAGVEVRFVYADSPAAKAGLEKRDVIVSFQNQSVSSADALWDLISRERPGNTVSVEYRRGAKHSTASLILSEITEELPFDLLDSFIPPPEDKEAAHKDLKVGLVNVDLEAHKHSYWAYVPEDYNPDHGYGLVVWVHPGGDTMEATIAQDWKPVCQERGLILLAPKAEKVSGWNLNEAEFVHDAVEDVRAKYNIDPARICLHSYADGGGFAYNLAFKYRELFAGVAVVADPLRQAPPENSPEYRQQFLLICGTKDKSFPGVKATHEGLRRFKFPSTLIEIEGRERRYLPPDEVRDVAIWIDTLDRL